MKTAETHNSKIYSMNYHSKTYMLKTYPHWWENRQVHVIHQHYIDKKWRQYINVYSNVYLNGTTTDSIKFKRRYGPLNFRIIV